MTQPPDNARTPGELRRFAMTEAVTLLAGTDPTPADVVAMATALAGYLDPVVLIVLQVSPVQQLNDPQSIRKAEGNPMQIRDNEQFDVTLLAKDAKGYDVAGEQFTATADNPAVVTLTQNGAAFTVAAGSPGSAVVTFTDGTISATLAVDVVPGNVATIEVTPGPVSAQPAA